jgi:membrane protease YdiL (CAAX protease family)
MGGGLIVWPSSLDFIKEWALDLEILYLAAIKELCTFSNISMFLGKGIMAGSLLPAIGEELFFRGVLQNILLQKTKKPFLAIIITSLFFSILHLRPYYSIMLFGLSVLFGYIYFISNNISLAIFAHFLNNSISFLTIYLFKNSVTTLDPIESFVKTLSFWHLIAGISICIFLVYTSFRKLIILQKIH